MDSAFDQELIHWIEQQLQLTRPLCLGICGAQGSGKSTLAQTVASHFRVRSFKIAVLSLDDLYFSRARRAELAATVHPLLQTRGVPGTHDVHQGIELLQSLKQLAPGQHLQLPRFNKADDNPASRDSWPIAEGPLDLIIFEGWCIGVTPQTAEALDQPINELEHTHDQDGRWRRWVNTQLAGDYQKLWAQLDRLIFLNIPSWEHVLRWRTQQEQDNARDGGEHLMDAAELARFIQHYERLSRHALQILPSIADVTRQLGPNHEAVSQAIQL